MGPGGAQELYGIVPDVTCLGKIIGGGLPVGAYGGRREIMRSMAPEGTIYQAGTLSGNPLAMAAGIATLKELRKKWIYKELEEKSRRLFSGLEDAARSEGIQVKVQRVGSMGSLFFTDHDVTDFATVKTSDAAMFKRFYAAMLDLGIYLAPSAFEAWFVSAAHEEKRSRKPSVWGQEFCPARTQ